MGKCQFTVPRLQPSLPLTLPHPTLKDLDRPPPMGTKTYGGPTL